MNIIKQRVSRRAGDSSRHVPNDFVRLQIPALDHLVLPARKQVGLARRDGESAYGVDVSRQRETQRACTWIEREVGGAQLGSDGRDGAHPPPKDRPAFALSLVSSAVHGCEPAFGQG